MIATYRTPDADRNARAVIQRLWSFCNVLKDDGVSYGDYVEQLTYLLFLKMEDEAIRETGRPSTLPKGARWSDLVGRSGIDLEARYIAALQLLGHAPGTVGRIFLRAQNKIQDGAKLKRLIKLIDAERWSDMDSDVKGTIYEGLLERNAEDVKSGAGQYFTPRPLVRAITAVVRPAVGESVCDPACGTGGFLLESLRVIRSRPGRRDSDLDPSILAGWEIVPATARLCLMSLYLRGVPDHEMDVNVGDALLAAPDRAFDVVLTNPPFGRRSSMTFSNEAAADADQLVYRRDDFLATTSNKQLNFLQHVMSLLGRKGRAAVVVPDSVLSEGGAGETVRRALLELFEVHTLLRLPPGIFYAGSVKSSVLFFDRRPTKSKPRGSERLWTYDMRTGKRFSLRSEPLTDEAMDDFIGRYGGTNRKSRTADGPFRSFAIGDILGFERCSLDLGLAIGSTSVDIAEPPSVIAAEIIDRLEAAADAIRAIEQDLAP